MEQRGKVVKRGPLDCGTLQDELIRHMTSVLGYGRTHFVGGRYSTPPLPIPGAEVARFHEMLVDPSAHLGRHTELCGVQPEQLLRGPFADAMTHAGQLTMLRRLAGIPVPPENFIVADISPERLRISLCRSVRIEYGRKHHRSGFRQKENSARPLIRKKTPSSECSSESIPIHAVVFTDSTFNSTKASQLRAA